MKKPQQPFKSRNYKFSPPQYEVKHSIVKRFITNEEEDLEDYNDMHDTELTEEEFESMLLGREGKIFTLKELMDAFQNVDPKDVVLSIDTDRYRTYINIEAEHRVPPDLKAWQDNKDAEDAEYEAKYAIYTKELAAYEKWEAEEKIKELQNKIKEIEKLK